MRPFSFTKNVGGLRQAYEAIRAGYSPGVTVKEFKARCGLGDQSLLVLEYFLSANVDGNDEYVLADSLIEQTISQPFSRLTARLYFFSVNLGMPGQRREEAAHEWAGMQNTLMREDLFGDIGYSATHFDKDHIQNVVSRYYKFSSSALRKWVTNYSFMAEQCGFVRTPEGRLETFPDTWGPLALRLFFERYLSVRPTSDVSELVSAAYAVSGTDF